MLLSVDIVQEKDRIRRKRMGSNESDAVSSFMQKLSKNILFQKNVFGGNTDISLTLQKQYCSNASRHWTPLPESYLPQDLTIKT